MKIAILVLALVCVAESLNINDLVKTVGDNLYGEESIGRMDIIKRALNMRHGSNMVEKNTMTIEEAIKEILKIKEKRDEKLDIEVRKVIKMSDEGKMTDDEIANKWNFIEKTRRSIDRDARLAIEEAARKYAPHREATIVDEVRSKLVNDMTRMTRETREMRGIRESRQESRERSEERVNHEIREMHRSNEKMAGEMTDDEFKTVLHNMKNVESSSEERKSFATDEEFANGEHHHHDEEDREDDEDEMITITMDREEMEMMLDEIKMELEREARNAVEDIFSRVKETIYGMATKHYNHDHIEQEMMEMMPKLMNKKNVNTDRRDILSEIIMSRQM